MSTDIQLTNALNMQTLDNKNQCPVCLKRFTQHANLRRHFRLHTGEKPFKCETCPKQFSDRSSLKWHIITHSNTRNIQCNYCSKLFYVENHARRHELTHIQDQSYICNICGKTLRRLDSLKYHLKNHAGELPYVCDVCGKTFSLKSVLKKHKQSFRCGGSGSKPLLSKTKTKEIKLRIYKETQNMTIDNSIVPCKKTNDAITKPLGTNSNNDKIITKTNKELMHYEASATNIHNARKDDSLYVKKSENTPEELLVITKSHIQDSISNTPEELPVNTKSQIQDSISNKPILIKTSLLTPSPSAGELHLDSYAFQNNDDGRYLLFVQSKQIDLGGNDSVRSRSSTVVSATRNDHLFTLPGSNDNFDSSFLKQGVAPINISPKTLQPNETNFVNTQSPYEDIAIADFHSLPNINDHYNQSTTKRLQTIITEENDTYISGSILRDKNRFQSADVTNYYNATDGYDSSYWCGNSFFDPNITIPYANNRAPSLFDKQLSIIMPNMVARDTLPPSLSSPTFFEEEYSVASKRTPSLFERQSSIIIPNMEEINTLPPTLLSPPFVEEDNYVPNILQISPSESRTRFHYPYSHKKSKILQPYELLFKLPFNDMRCNICFRHSGSDQDRNLHTCL